jgi:hypothetical protein
MKEMERSEHQEFGDIEEMDKETAKTVKRFDGLPTVEDLKKLLGDAKGGKPEGIMVIEESHGPMQMGGSCGESRLDSLGKFLDGLMGLLK